MRVELMVVEDCPHLAPAEAMLREALARMPVDAGYRVTTVGFEAPLPTGFGGSPTFLIEGRDPFEGGQASYSCRRYLHADGTMSGVPEADELRHVLHTATSAGDGGRV